MIGDDEFAGPQPEPATVRPSPLRFSLFALMSATAVFAVWMAYYLTTQETKRMEMQLPSLRDMARELRIADPQQYAAVRHHQLSFQDNRWREYLPPGDKYQLCVATKNSGPFPPSQRLKSAPSSVAPIASGERELALAYERQGENWLIQVSVDGEIVLQETQPAAWNPGHGSTGGNTISASRQSATAEPLILYDTVFHILVPNRPGTTSSKDSETGLRLWVENLD